MVVRIACEVGSREVVPHLWAAFALLEQADVRPPAGLPVGEAGTVADARQRSDESSTQCINTTCRYLLIGPSTWDLGRGEYRLLLQHGLVLGCSSGITYPMRRAPRDLR